MSEHALFAPTGDPTVWRPTAWSRGPWNPEHCHGGPVSAFLARAVENIDDGSDVKWQVARLTIELLRPVVVEAPLRLTTDIERPGLKVSLVAASLTDAGSGKEVARVRALRIRRAGFELPDHPTGDLDDMGEPGSGRVESLQWDESDGEGVAYHRSSCTHRWVMGSFADAGPCRVWIRLDVAVVPGDKPSGLSRVAAAADFGNGVSGALPAAKFSYINPDLTIHLARPYVGDWVGMASHSLYGTEGRTSGAGWAESALYDAAGRLGRSIQSLILQRT